MIKNLVPVSEFLIFFAEYRAVLDLRCFGMMKNHKEKIYIEETPESIRCP
jgi:hypothetical protein